MPRWLEFIWIEIRLLALLLLDLVFLNWILLFGLVYAPLWLGFLAIVDHGIYLRQGVFWFLVIGAGVSIYRLKQGSAQPEADEPLRTTLAPFPALKSAVDRASAEVGRRSPAEVYFVLSPKPWRYLGCDAQRMRDAGKLVIPIGCLGTWSVVGLSCDVAHFAVRQRPSRLLFALVRGSINRLSTEQFQHENRGTDNWRSRMVASFIERYTSLIAIWSFLADLDADGRVAERYGSQAVVTWLQQSELLNAVVPDCVKLLEEIASERGLLLPVAAACAATHNSASRPWIDALNQEIAGVEKGTSSAALAVRLAILQQYSAAADAFDPRLAATLIEELESLEEQVLKSETAIKGPLSRITMDQIGSLVLVPERREDLARNGALLEGKTIADVPAMVRDLAQLAPAYVADPRYLFHSSQREDLVVSLLEAFFTVELQRLGWQCLYSMDEGLWLERGTERVTPHGVVAELRAGQLSEEDFTRRFTSRA